MKYFSFDECQYCKGHCGFRQEVWQKGKVRVMAYACSPVCPAFVSALGFDRCCTPIGENLSVASAFNGDGVCAIEVQSSLGLWTVVGAGEPCEAAELAWQALEKLGVPEAHLDELDDLLWSGPRVRVWAGMALAADRPAVDQRSAARDFEGQWLANLERLPKRSSLNGV